MGMPVAFDSSFLMPTKLQGSGTNKEIKSEERLEQTAQEFEAVLLTSLLKEMRKSIPKSGLLDEEDKAGELYFEMMDVALAQYIARSKQTGLSREICKQLGGQTERAIHEVSAPEGSDEHDR